jgi:hypothetical protein
MRTDTKAAKCDGCGHRLTKHRHYARGVNRHGSRLVCTVDGCQHWRDCHTQGKRPA